MKTCGCLLCDSLIIPLAIRRVKQVMYADKVNLLLSIQAKLWFQSQEIKRYKWKYYRVFLLIGGCGLVRSHFVLREFSEWKILSTKCSQLDQAMLEVSNLMSETNRKFGNVRYIKPGILLSIPIFYSESLPRMKILYNIRCMQRTQIFGLSSHEFKPHCPKLTSHLLSNPLLNFPHCHL